jgi:hypothetical protein
MVPWSVGKYVLCPLRWHGISTSGQSRWWHVRAYAESELLGLLSPGHAGADLWRAYRLNGVGLCRASALTEVTIDRLIGAIGIALGVLVTGVALPRKVFVTLLAVCLVIIAAVLVLRWRRPALFSRRPLPRPRVVIQGLLLSLLYQASIAGLVFGTVFALGYTVDLLPLLAVFGASQIASVVPGMHGVSPRNGALAVGLTSLGVSWTAALGAVALIALLAWVPALLFGGGSFTARRLARIRLMRPVRGIGFG